MTPVAIRFVIAHSKTPQAYFIVFFERFETNKQKQLTLCLSAK